ncbi:MAG: DUF3153 domain-containing protein [Coleofasciculus sp. S288]|nr:DUF3153 domain-containing protein [Coleofasciculus sp. S288]
MKRAVVYLLQFSRRILGRLRVLWVILLAAVLLSGCVQYNVGVNFEGEHHGQIVQQIKLGEQLTTFSNDQAQEWLISIERRAKQLHGKTNRLSDREIVVTIPFSSGAELTSKFNQFFNPVIKKDSPSKAVETVDLPQFDSKLRLEQGNFFFWQRNHLSYDLDLRSLGVVSAKGNVVVTPDSLLDLQFRLETPWGAKRVKRDMDALSPEVYDNGRQLVWKLKPGQLNHIEAVFWLPSPLGFGAIAILLLVLGGFYLKYKSFPWSATEPIAPATLSEVQ